MRNLFLALFLFLSIQAVYAQTNIALPVVKSTIKGINIYGKPIDQQTRCQHWHSELDVIAIKFKCCEKYYPCFSCHEEEADHEPKVWPKSEFDSKAILCGVCGTELSITEYQSSNNTCPNCKAAFNPGCSKHYHLYFDTEGKKIE
ncbi:CHY zinc finger protein [Algoriphagus pacificus]|uniref:Chromophore lyase n=1 Tax=Algoriphagus pacificus TaxID=2811234 RepID=A0ABS3CJ13_9BACT|nr:CHY zinc finger protein [Algoriphagus pacificus]MBN7816476.1 chromophore lyase [Algoriphagus pacificus]